MTQFGLVLFSLVLSLVSPVAEDIENAFLNNDPKGLKTLLAPGSFLHVSFPEPIAFSDPLSDEQAILYFRRLFALYKTIGFYPEGTALRSLDGGAFIFKARWECKPKDGPPIALQILFDIRGRPSGPGSPGFWRIVQIRAERT